MKLIFRYIYMLISLCGFITVFFVAQAAETQLEIATTEVYEEHLNLNYFKHRYTDDLDELKQRRIIRALIVPGRTDFYLTKGKVDGLIIKLLNEYEKYLNKGIKKEAEKIHVLYVPVNFDELIPSLLTGRGDIVAGFITMTDVRKQQVNFASGHGMKMNELIVTNRNSDIKLAGLEDLAGQSIYVLQGSSYADHLKEWNNYFVTKGLQPINIVEAEQYLNSEDILEMVNAGAIDITVIDDFKAMLWAKVLPNIEVREDLIINEGGVIGWLVRKNNPELLQNLEGFIKTIKKGTLLGNTLYQQFYGRDQKLENLQLNDERKKYKEFIDLFKKYGDQYDIDYLKLIAQGYQESGLKQNTRSHRGAVGIMQLLPSTAADKNVDIKNIDQLENNVHAGAKYMHFLRTRYFSDPDITTENQIFFSWAAYNAGPANVRKMRNLAEQMGLDKNIWFDNVEVAAGKLIGIETVRYVSNIYKYYSTYLLLEKQQQSQ